MWTIILTATVMLLSGLPAFAQNTTITGVVRDENGEALIGAGVVTADGKKGTVTDINGFYSLTVGPKDAILVYSFIAYAQQEIVIGGRKKIDVQLMPDTSNNLNEVVVIGYGTTKKADLTGSVTNVKMQDIATDPAVSVDQALQGRVAGMDVMTTSGDPSAGTSIRIRGTRSINASNEPLIIVDGVMDAVADISEINPDDIESISVMKDASSTAIYGSRGSNGVILITTKKGTTNKPTVKVKASFGISTLAKELDIMNAEELVRYRNSRYPNSSKPAYDPEDITNDTNWLRAITRVAPYQDYTVTLSGKITDKFNYYAALGYNDNQGIVIESGQKRVTGRLKLSYDIARWFNLAFNASYTFRSQDVVKATIGGTNLYNGAIYLSPTIGLYDSYNPLYENGTRINNPYILAKYTDHNREYLTSNNNLIFTFKPVKGLVIKSQNSYMVYQRHDYKFNPSYLPTKREGEGADAYRYEGDARGFSSENTVSYTPRLRGGHKLKVLGGYSVNSKSMNYFSLTALGLLVDELKWNNMAGVLSKENYTAYTTNESVVKQSVFLRADYSWKSRYYLTVTCRYDGASNFADNNKWGFFPSAAFKWAMKNEKWLKNVKDVNELSIRLSAGRTGNDAISYYRSLQAYSSTTSSYPINGTQGAAFYPSRVANPDLTWEKTTLYNVAVDGSFFKNRLGFSAEVYYSYTDDLLLNLKTIQSTGFSSRLTNLGRTTNSGVEFTLNGKIIENKKFGWSSDFTISHNNQMVDNIGQEEYVATMMSPGNTSFMMYGYKKGYPLNALWGFQYAGVWHNANEFERNKYTKSYVTNTTSNSASEILGMPKYVDQNHDGILSEQDLVYLGNSDPVVYGGWQNTFHLKNWTLGIYLSYSFGGSIYNYSEFAMSGGYYTNQYRYMLNCWHPTRNPDSDIPRSGYDDRAVPSDFIAHDATYIRLKNVYLSYRFDFRKKQKSAFKDLTLTLTGNNLWLWSKYNGFDPDVSTNSSESTLRRVDIGAYPRARQVVLTATLRF